jgi:hypothetical protein
MSNPTILPPANRIIAIGDMHGDMNLVLDCLLLSNVIQKTKNKKNSIQVKLHSKIQYYVWSGKDTIIVQIGDQIDSCRPSNSESSSCNGDTDFAEDIEILEFFSKLHEQAQKEKGGVYSLLGNHELMNVEGNFTYVSKANINMFKTYVDPYTQQKFRNPYEARTHAFSPGNEYAKLFANTRQSVLIIGDFLFIHAGLSPEFIDNFRGREKLANLNIIVQQWLLNKLNTDIITNEQLDKILNDAEYSPFWNRVLGNLKPNLPYTNKECQDALNPIIDSYKIKGMIIGHTPQIETGINSTCDNKIFRVDFGGSRAFDSSKKREPQVLEIVKLSDGSYKYSILFEKKEKYDFIVPDDNTAFNRIESTLPYR